MSPNSSITRGLAVKSLSIISSRRRQAATESLYSWRLLRSMAGTRSHKGPQPSRGGGHQNLFGLNRIGGGHDAAGQEPLEFVALNHLLGQDLLADAFQ